MPVKSLLDRCSTFCLAQRVALLVEEDSFHSRRAGIDAEQVGPLRGQMRHVFGSTITGRIPSMRHSSSIGPRTSPYTMA